MTGPQVGALHGTAGKRGQADHGLLYTSAPRGLRPGSRGFCTVATTAEFPPSLFPPLESLSGYHHLPGIDPASGHGPPVNVSHVRLRVAGRPIHVLSRIAPAAADYTGRTNKLAHHRLVPTASLHDSGPATCAGQSGIWVHQWDGKVGHFNQTTFTNQPVTSRIANRWAAVMGDAGWAGVLADWVADSDPTPIYVRHRIDQNASLLEMLAETEALLEPERRWGMTFATYANDISPEVDCQIRCVVEGTPDFERTSARLIDLCRGGSAANAPASSPRVNLARTGGTQSAAVPLSDRSLRNDPSPMVPPVASTANGEGPMGLAPPPIRRTAKSSPAPDRDAAAGAPGGARVPGRVQVPASVPAIPPDANPIAPAQTRRTWTFVAAGAVIVLLVGMGGVIFRTLQSDGALMSDLQASASGTPDPPTNEQVAPPSDSVSPANDLIPPDDAAPGDAAPGGDAEMDPIPTPASTAAIDAPAKPADSMPRSEADSKPAETSSPDDGLQKLQSLAERVEDFQQSCQKLLAQSHQVNQRVSDLVAAAENGVSFAGEVVRSFTELDSVERLFEQLDDDLKSLEKLGDRLSQDVSATKAPDTQDMDTQDLLQATRTRLTQTRSKLSIDFSARESLAKLRARLRQRWDLERTVKVRIRPNQGEHLYEARIDDFPIPLEIPDAALDRYEGRHFIKLQIGGTPRRVNNDREADESGSALKFFLTKTDDRTILYCHATVLTPSGRPRPGDLVALQPLRQYLSLLSETSRKRADSQVKAREFSNQLESFGKWAKRQKFGPGPTMIKKAAKTVFYKLLEQAKPDGDLALFLDPAGLSTSGADAVAGQPPADFKLLFDLLQADSFSRSGLSLEQAQRYRERHENMLVEIQNLRQQVGRAAGRRKSAIETESMNKLVDAYAAYADSMVDFLVQWIQLNEHQRSMLESSPRPSGEAETLQILDATSDADQAEVLGAFPLDLLFEIQF